MENMESGWDCAVNRVSMYAWDMEMAGKVVDRIHEIQLDPNVPDAVKNMSPTEVNTECYFAGLEWKVDAATMIGDCMSFGSDGLATTRNIRNQGACILIANLFSNI